MKDTDLLDVTISDSGDVQIADLSADEVEARINGSGEIDLAGEAAAQKVTISGLGSYQTGGLRGESVVVKISGSGDATVWATDSLDETSAEVALWITKEGHRSACLAAVPVRSIAWARNKPTARNLLSRTRPL